MIQMKFSLLKMNKKPEVINKFYESTKGLGLHFKDLKISIKNKIRVMKDNYYEHIYINKINYESNILNLEMLNASLEKQIKTIKEKDIYSNNIRSEIKLIATPVKQKGKNLLQDLRYSIIYNRQKKLFDKKIGQYLNSIQNKQFKKNLKLKMESIKKLQDIYRSMINSFEFII